LNQELQDFQDCR